MCKIKITIFLSLTFVLYATIKKIAEPHYCNKNYMSINYSSVVSEGVPLPDQEERGGHSGGLINNKVIIVGGTNWNKDKSSKLFLSNSLIFDDTAWINGPSLPIPMAYSMFGHDDSGLYVAGGTSDGVTMIGKAFVLKSGQNAVWEILPDLPEPVGFGSGSIMNGIFYISGGLLNSGERTNKMWALHLNNLESGWIELKSLPGQPRILHSLVGCKDDLYLIGGLAENSPLTPLKDVYKFDCKEKNWKKLNDLPMKGYAWVAQSFADKNLLMTGRADGQIHSDIWIIDLNSMSLKKIGNLVISSTTAPLIKVTTNQWWLVSGEPDSNKNRTKAVSIINLINEDDKNNIH